MPMVTDITQEAQQRREANFKRLGFSVDPRGHWTKRQAQEVLRVVAPEAIKHDIAFHMINITQHAGDDPDIFVLIPRCTTHHKPLIGWQCGMCERTKGRTFEAERNTDLINDLEQALFPHQESEFEQESFTPEGRQRVDKWIDKLRIVLVTQ